MEVGTQQWGTVAVGKAESVDSISSIWEIITMPMVDLFIIDLEWVVIGIRCTDAYRVPQAWTMVTVMNQGNPGVAKTY